MVLKGEVALKLDVGKSYDRVEWRYLKIRMHQMGFSDIWIRRVVLCVTTISPSVLMDQIEDLLFQNEVCDMDIIYLC